MTMLFTAEELAHDPLLYIRFRDHYSHSGSKEGIDECVLESVGWFIEEDDLHIKIAWLRDDFKNGHDSLNGESYMVILKSAIIEQKEINMV